MLSPLPQTLPTLERLALISTVVLLFALPARAQDRYVELLFGTGSLDDGGGLTIEDARFGTLADTDYDSGLAFGLAFGTRLGKSWQLEGDYIYRRNELSDTVFSDGLQIDEGDYASVVISASLQYLFRPDQNVRPYLGVGFGWVQEVDIDFVVDCQENSFETDDFVLQLQAGVEWDLSERWSLSAEARWLEVSGLTMEAEEGNGTVEADYQPWSLLVGLGWRF